MFPGALLIVVKVGRSHEVTTEIYRMLNARNIFSIVVDHGTILIITSCVLSPNVNHYCIGRFHTITTITTIITITPYIPIYRLQLQYTRYRALFIGLRFRFISEMYLVPGIIFGRGAYTTACVVVRTPSLLNNFDVFLKCVKFDKLI